MILAAAVCPHPPVLLPGLGGAADPGGPLRAACGPAVRAVLGAGPELVVVVGGADRSGRPDPGARFDLAAYGPSPGRSGPGADGAAETLPLSLAVGDRLLAAAGWTGRTERRAIGWQAAPTECERLGRELAARPERLALLVLADGSARRGERAPGHLDARAEPFDTALGLALATGDAAALHRLDPGLAADLLVQGRAALQVLAGACTAGGAAPIATLHHTDDPFGVYCVVASWLFPDGADA